MEGQVVAHDFTENPSFTVLNKDHVIANASSNGSFRLEVLIARGKDMLPQVTIRRIRTSCGLDILTLFFQFKVNYSVTNSRVGKRTDYDKLTLEVYR